MSNRGAVAACRCGSPVAIRKTGECKSCYMARRHREHSAAVLASPCVKCGNRPAVVVRTRLCAECRPPAKPRQTGAQRAVAGSETYSAAHSRVNHARGPASLWRCIRCGNQAHEWAYRPTPTRERSGPVVDAHRTRNMSWSPDPADYDPMCRPCHAIRDGRPEHGTGYRSNPDKEREYRRRWRANSYQRAVATEEGREQYRARKRRERQLREERRRAAVTDDDGP